MHGGFRFSTSVGGTLTGRGGDLIIIDDPIKPDDAMSEAARRRALDWFKGTVSSRLDNKTKGAMIVVMQRLHVDDIAGHILDRGGWKHLCLPAIAVDDERLPIGDGKVLRRRPGDVLDQAREPRHELDQLRANMGSAAFEAQYQQQPIPQEGNIVNWSWFRSYGAVPQRGYNDNLVMSWDTAFGASDLGDYTVGLLALVKPDGSTFILDVIRERMKFPEIQQRMQMLQQQDRGLITLVESAGSGIALCQQLQGRINIIPLLPDGDKVLRLGAVSPMIEGGQVYLPKIASWMEAFKRELLLFPNGRHDDQVDALSQLLGWVKQRLQHGVHQTSHGR